MYNKTFNVKGCDGVGWIQVIHDRAQWRFLQNKIIGLGAL